MEPGVAVLHGRFSPPSCNDRPWLPNSLCQSSSPAAIRQAEFMVEEMVHGT